MSLIFGTIVPHPPIIIPEIGKKDLDKVQKTVSALKELEGELYVMQPDVLVVISPHAPMSEEAFSLNLAPYFEGNLKEFGDQKTKLKLACDIELISDFKEKADDEDIPVNMISQIKLDHGSIVPLYYLTQHLPQVKIVPVSYSLLDLKTHYQFGNILRRVSLESNKRIAVIASGDLSHRLTDDAPAGYSPEGEAFDQTLIKLLENKKTEDILKLNPKLIKEAGECGLRSIVILLGALKELNYDVRVLSYEGPFGVGYLVAQFSLR